MAEAGNIDDAKRMVRAHRPGVLVLDLNMPGGESLPAIPELAEHTAVVVLTMQNDPAFARRALQDGATGYVLKEAADAELVQAVQAAAEGRTYLNPQLGARMAAAPPAPEGPPDDLTAREVEILRLIALGHTNAEIGGQLYLSVRTIESHRAHIQQKTGRNSRAELVRYALDHSLLDDAHELARRLRALPPPRRARLGQTASHARDGARRAGTRVAPRRATGPRAGRRPGADPRARLRRVPYRPARARRRGGVRDAGRAGPPDRRDGRGHGRAGRRALARVDLRRVLLLPLGTGEPVRPRALHRLRPRRRVRRVRRRGRALLLPAPRGLSRTCRRPRCCAPG